MDSQRVPDSGAKRTEFYFLQFYRTCQRKYYFFADRNYGWEKIYGEAGGEVDFYHELRTN